MGDARVRKYFEEIAVEFDRIYENKGSILDRFINRVFRRGMYERFTRTIEESGDVKGKSVLDIGCGSGRTALVLAEKGAKVTGIDYSSKMIALANDYLSRYKNTNAEFLCCDFMADFPSDNTFDIALALGVSDYMINPMRLLKKMIEVTNGMMIVSYPAKFSLQAPIRKAWLLTRNCPVYFYSIKRLTEMYESLEVRDYKIIRLPSGTRIPTDYLVKAVL